MEKSSCVLTLLLFFFVQKAPGENCTALFETCITTLVAGQVKSIITPPKSDKIWCKDDSLEKTCTSYTIFFLCVNNNMANCTEDEEISAQIAVLQQTYKLYCAKELLCGTRILNCLCEAELVSDFTNVTKMCNNQEHFRQCIRKIKDCDHIKAIQQATLFSAMTEVVCTATTFLPSCPEFFKCSLGRSQSALGFSGMPGVTETMCMILTHAVGCVDHMKDICNVTINLNVPLMKTSLDYACKGTDASNGTSIPARDTHSSNGSGIPTSGLERLFSVTFVSLVMAALTLVKV